ncbi:MAG: glycosyltransferase family 4 protein [Phycisphaerales bacterium]|nr:MAG: glycosyltransferase family 4 protein [Phycisphaerales bacterium]
MRVLYCILDNRVGGPHRLALTVSRHLKRHHIETLFLVGRKTDDPWQPDEAQLFQLTHIQCFQRRAALLNLARFLGFLPYNLLRIRRLIRAHQIDIVHVDGVTNFVPALAATLTRVPVVWTYNDYIGPRLRKIFLPIVARLADRIIIQGENIRTRYPRNHRRLEEKIVFLPSAVDPQEFDPDRFTARDREALRAEFQIPADHALIGTIGNINVMKGHDDFIEAAGQLKQRQPKTRFLIVGRQLDTASDYWDRLQALLDRLGLRDDVIFTGFRTDIARICHALDVFVLPSILESCPVVVLEAMAMKVPVVATDVGAVSEMVVAGRTGLLVPPRDAGAIAEAVTTCLGQSPAERDAMTEAARKRVETDFAVDRIAFRQKRMYEALGARPGDHG